MNLSTVRFLGAAALAACLLSPAEAARHYNLSVNSGNGDSCADLKARSSDGEIAQAEQTFTFQKSEAPVLALSGAERGAIRVRGADRGDYSVQVCKIAVAENRAAAEQLLSAVTVGRSGGRFFTNAPSGPAYDDVNWQLYFIVHAPKDANIELDTKNGPIEVSGITGSTKVRATNGPVSVKSVAGIVDVQTVNGPIAFEGGGGEVQLNATNGPISLDLQGQAWNGSKLEARTKNGPVSLTLPDSYQTGIRLEASAHAPIECGAGVCQSALSNAGSNQRVLRLNGGSDTIRVITNNGPVSVHGPKPARRII